MLFSTQLSTACHIHYLLLPSKDSAFLHALPAVPRYLLRGVPSDVKLKEVGVKERLRAAIPMRFLFIFFRSFSKADIIDFPHLKHSHCGTFCHPIDWN